jgi:uncharacterized peroxidase-related enzyme
MSWIQKITPEGAEGELADFYRAIGGSRGGVAEVHQVQSLNPRAMKAHLELYKAVVFARSSLSRIRRERIAVTVSAANECRYCVGHHSEALRNLRDEPATFEALGRGEFPDALSGADAALLRWAREMTLRPADANEARVAELRELGFDDRAILDATLTIGYFNFVNRLVLLLGCDLEEGYADTCGDEEA